MSAANPLTNFPISTFPITTKLNPLSFSLSLRHRCSSRNLLLSRDFLSVEYTNWRKGGLMAERVIRISAIESGDGEENVRVLEQEAFVDGSSQLGSNLVSVDLEAFLNRLSKWLVAALFGALVLWRHDAEALWAAMGSVVNAGLSVVLKRILNQERPFPNMKSDPGMPSSHAQSIFFAIMFLVVSMVEWLGFNTVTLMFAVISLVFGSYLSWLRVTQQLHTVSQVTVGAVLGSCFSLLWLWSWDSLILDAFNSSLWVRVSVLLTSVISCLGFLTYVLLYWLNDER